MRIRLAIPDRLVTPEALEAALEATTLANEQAIRHGEVPEIEDAIADGVRWKPEPFTDGEHFDLAEQVMGRGWGDCDDLAPWLAGDLRASGEDPGAVPRVYQSGPGRWHVVVQTSDGEILDPSRWAGMGKHKVSGVSPAIAKPFARPGQGALVVMPHGGHYWARADVPFPGTIAHLASHARASTPEAAIAKAIDGALAVGECLDTDCEQMDLAGVLMCGDEDDLIDVGIDPMDLASTAASAIPIPGVAPLASTLLKGVSNLFGVSPKTRRRRRRRARRHAREAAAAAAKQAAAMKHHGHGHGKPVNRAIARPDQRHLFLSFYPNGKGPVVLRF